MNLYGHYMICTSFNYSIFFYEYYYFFFLSILYQLIFYLRFRFYIHLNFHLYRGLDIIFFFTILIIIIFYRVCFLVLISSRIITFLFVFVFKCIYTATIVKLFYKMRGTIILCSPGYIVYCNCFKANTKTDIETVYSL